MGQFALEDETGAIGVVVFPDLWESCPPLDGEPVVVVQGNLRGDAAGAPGGSRRRGQRGELAASEIWLADEAPYLLAREVELLVSEPERLGDDLRDLLRDHAGQRPLHLRVRAHGIEFLLGTATRIQPSRAFARAAWELLGPDTLLLDGRTPPSFAH